MKGTRAVAKALVVGEMACRGSASIAASLPGRFKAFCKEVGEHRDTILEPGRAATEAILSAALKGEELTEDELGKVADGLVEEAAARLGNGTAEEHRVPCPACGRRVHESGLAPGTGKYANKLVCGPCESENYAEQVKESGLYPGEEELWMEHPTEEEWEAPQTWDRSKVVDGEGPERHKRVKEPVVTQ